MSGFQLLVSGLANGCVYGLIALGFVLIYKATEAVNFAQGDMMMLGAFIAIALTESGGMQLPLWLAIPATIVLMSLFGYVLDLLVLRRMSGESQIAVVMLTIAVGYVLRFVVGAVWGHDPVSLSTPISGRFFSVNGVIVGVDEVVIVLVTVVLTGLLYAFFRFTKIGVAMQAASQNQLAAYYMGIPVRRIQSLTWALAGATAAIAGILFATKGTVDANTGLLGIKAFAAAVIGGFGSLPGALLGGILVGLVEPFAARYVAPGYSQVTPYVMLLLVLVLRPHGLFAQVYSKKV